MMPTAQITGQKNTQFNSNLNQSGFNSTSSCLITKNGERSTNDKTLNNVNSTSSQVSSESSLLTNLNNEIENNINQAKNTDLINQKILTYLTNNNIDDSLAKESVSKDNQLFQEFIPSVKDAKENLNKNELNLETNRDNLISQTTSSSAAFNCSKNENQKSKNKKFANNKNRDSSSSNGSLVSNLNQPINKEDKLPKNWKFSKTHQKRFKRRFPTIEADEQLIDWFSCALIADILLQGYLYISENYFAFYSNIFGYKTHVLVRVSDVDEITKEKTAKIFPNAVGIRTKQNKFVFGSLLSRESTFKLLNEVKSSYLDLSKIELSEDDFKNGETLTSTKAVTLNKHIAQSKDELNSSSNELIDNKKILHSDDFKIDNKLDSSRCLHRRSSSLKSSVKEQQDNDQNSIRKLNQTKLLKQSKFSEFNSFLKLSSFKSILRFDLKRSKSSFLILSIVFLLFLLLLSISILLIRINNAHDKLISMSKYSQKITVPEIDLFNEMYKMIKALDDLREISQLRSKLS